MLPRPLPLRLVVIVPLLGFILVMPATVFLGCADSATSTPTNGDGGVAIDGARLKDAASSKDAGARSTCAITRAYFELCGNEADLTCGTNGFDAWCEANDTGLNSAAYRRAEALCLELEAKNCDGKKRRACEYEHYNSEAPTASQASLVAAYCAMCESSDLPGCTTRSTKFDVTKGEGSVGDVFVAAWEFSDPIVDEMRMKCTEVASTDAGQDVATCAKTFGGCTADIYLTRLPECPK